MLWHDAQVSVLAARGVRRAIRLALALLVGVVVVAGFSAGVYRSNYNVWPGQGASARVHWCGRDYENSDGATMSWSDVVSQNAPFPVRLVGQYPPLAWSRQQLFAAVTPHAQRYSVSPPLPCSMAVYLRTGPSTYKAYSLLGGP
jgi:hypothetical protein